MTLRVRPLWNVWLLTPMLDQCGVSGSDHLSAPIEKKINGAACREDCCSLIALIGKDQILILLNWADGKY